MKNHHGLNEEKTFIGKNYLSIECLWYNSVISLDTNNQV
jgi:hypothetical protein